MTANWGDSTCVSFAIIFYYPIQRTNNNEFRGFFDRWQILRKSNSENLGGEKTRVV